MTDRNPSNPRVTLDLELVQALIDDHDDMQAALSNTKWPEFNSARWLATCSTLDAVVEALEAEGFERDRVSSPCCGANLQSHDCGRPHCKLCVKCRRVIGL